MRLHLLMVFISGFIRELTPNAEGMFYDPITRSVRVLVFKMWGNKTLDRGLRPSLCFSQLTLAMRLTPLPSFIPRCGCNTSKMPRQMPVCVCVCPARLSSQFGPFSSMPGLSSSFPHPAVMSLKRPREWHLVGTSVASVLNGLES